MFCYILLSTVALVGLVAEPAAAPKTQINRKQAVKIALVHLNVDKVTKELSEAFKLRVDELKLTANRVKELDDLRHGVTKRIDVDGLPMTFDVFQVSIQHGLSGDSTVYVAKNGGRVVLVKFVSEG